LAAAERGLNNGAGREASPDDIAALKEALAVERAKALEIAAELAVARAKLRKTAR
jgi:hypothetical protein